MSDREAVLEELRVHSRLRPSQRWDAEDALFVRAVEAGIPRYEIAQIVGEKATRVGKIVQREQERRNPRLREEREARRARSLLASLPEDLRAEVVAAFSERAEAKPAPLADEIAARVVARLFHAAVTLGACATGFEILAQRAPEATEQRLRDRVLRDDWS